MPIIVVCECGKRFSAAERFAGRETSCPACGRKLVVPGAPSAGGGGPDRLRVQEYFNKRAAAGGEASASAGEDDVIDLEDAEEQGPTAAASEPLPPPPRRKFLEILLDPRSIQWMLTLGGVLMVLGLVIWLASFPFFKRPEVLAILLGVGTLAILASGCFVALKTRYKVAGQALAFLACAIAPLNLWFYHAQNLITLSGHLWVAGLVCCILYAATAYALRDPLFIYAVAGGVTLTVLLFMAEFGVINQMPTLSMALVILGAIMIHAERAFPPEEGTFSRRRFGMPFFWSGQAQVGVGLLVMLAAQAMALLQVPVKSFLGYEWGGVEPAGFPVIPLAIWFAGAYIYLYSDIVVRRIGLYTFLAAICVLMAEVTLIRWWRPEPPFQIAILAVTAFAANLLRVSLTPDRDKLVRALAPLGVALSALPLLLGVVLHARSTSLVLFRNWEYQADWWFVAAMLLVALTSRASAFLSRKDKPAWAATYFFFSAAALMIAVAGLLHMLGIPRWTQQAPILMVIPIAYMIASRLWRGHSPEHPLAWVAQTATVFLWVPVLLDSLEGMGSFTTGAEANLWHGVFFTEAAAFYVFTAAVRKRGTKVYLAAVMAAGAIWQFLAYFDTPEPYFAVVFSLLGLVLLVIYRLAGKESFENRGLALPAFQCGNAALSFAFVSAMLQGLARLASSDVQRIDLFALLITTAVSLLAACLVSVRGWKRWYVSTTVGMAALSFVMINVLSVLNGWQKLEIFCVVTGLAMLVVGYLGRLREESGVPNDLISLSLWMGSVLATLPILIAVLYNRFEVHRLSTIDEISLLTITVLMVFTGYVLQFKATTLIGGVALVAHLAILLVFIGMQAQVALGVYLALGGAAVFGAGIALAVYRERLLSLPDRIARKEGVFKVFSWR